MRPRGPTFPPTDDSARADSQREQLVARMELTFFPTVCDRGAQLQANRPTRQSRGGVARSPPRCLKRRSARLAQTAGPRARWPPRLSPRRLAARAGDRAHGVSNGSAHFRRPRSAASGHSTRAPVARRCGAPAAALREAPRSWLGPRGSTFPPATLTDSRREQRVGRVGFSCVPHRSKSPLKTVGELGRGCHVSVMRTCWAARIFFVACPAFWAGINL